MTAVTNIYRHKLMIYLESRGWVFFNNIAGVMCVKLGDLKFYDIEAAVDHQRHLEEMVKAKIRAAAPLYHWGKDFAASIDLRRASQ